MSAVSRKRHIVKAITWRGVASTITFLLSWVMTGNVTAGLKIGAWDVIVKLLFYYGHERVWYKFSKLSSKARHLFKSFTWRLIASGTTFGLTWILTGDIEAGIKVGLLDVIIKLIAYYGHERLWHRSKFGVEDESVE